ncbi:MAG TPA: hypothetical protein HPQ00_17685, partial [Magnetococcales bacterium]|nr:hypothetical protein [Magnetococcales bacterium]
ADYCLRAKQAGFTITVLPDLKIWNDTSSSGLPHKNRLDLFLRSFIDNKSWFNLRTQVLWVWRFGRSPRGWLNLLRLYAGYVGGFFFWKILELLGIHRKGSEKKSTPDGWLMEWIYLLLGLRLFIYNKVINRLPFAILRRSFQKYYLTLGEGSNILPGVEFLYTGLDRGKIRIGKHSVVGTNVLLDGRVGRIEIGDNVDIARECCLYTLEHDPHSDQHHVRGANIIIEDHVWLASRVTVLPGVTIGQGAVVASNAVVTRDVEPMAVVAGIPAKKIGVRKSKLDYVLSHFPYFC